MLYISQYALPHRLQSNRISNQSVFYFFFAIGQSVVVFGVLADLIGYRVDLLFKSSRDCNPPLLASSSSYRVFIAAVVAIGFILSLFFVTNAFLPKSGDVADVENKFGWTDIQWEKCQFALTVRILNALRVIVDNRLF